MKYLKDFSLLFLWMLIGGFYSVSLGQDASFDLQNYHLYTPFAFLENRWYADIIPVGIHTFFNPLLDIPYYLLVKHFNHWPKLIAFYQGIFYGIFGFFIWKSSRLFFCGKTNRAFAIIATLIGCTGLATLVQIGLSSNEVHLAALMAASFYLFLLFFFSKRIFSPWIIFLSAFLAASAFGLKYTCAPFAVGLSAAFLFNFFRREQSAKIFLFFASGLLTGFLATNGIFMYRLWIQYGNPLFPFYNKLFLSPYFAAENFADRHFCPVGLWHYLSFPFTWVKPSITVGEYHLADAHIAYAYVSFFILSLLLCFKKIKTPFSRKAMISVLLFTGVYYAAWLYAYCILRYAVILEAITGFLIVGACAMIFRKKLAQFVAFSLALLLLMTMHLPDWGHVDFSDKAVAVDVPQIEENSLVIFFGSPFGFMAPFFPLGTRFAGGIKYPKEKYPPHMQAEVQSRNPLLSSYYKYDFDEELLKAIREHEGAIYLVSYPWAMIVHPITLEPFGLRGNVKDCLSFGSNLTMYQSNFSLCKLSKITEKNGE